LSSLRTLYPKKANIGELRVLHLEDAFRQAGHDECDQNERGDREARAHGALAHVVAAHAVRDHPVVHLHGHELLGLFLRVELAVVAVAGRRDEQRRADLALVRVVGQLRRQVGGELHRAVAAICRQLCRCC